jgi:hypothetical protein
MKAAGKYSFILLSSIKFFIFIEKHGAYMFGYTEVIKQV